MSSQSRLLFPVLLVVLSPLSWAQARQPITVADASLAAAFYSDSSCLLTIDANTQKGKTVIDANVDGEVSRMLIHCDTDDGRRLTLLARGDALNVAQRARLLTREEIEEGEQGMIAWLTRSGVHYADDTAPRRYVIAGSVFLRKSPPVQATGNALHNQRHAFGRLVGILEPLLKSKNPTVAIPLPLAMDPESSQPLPADTSATDSPAEESQDGKITLGNDDPASQPEADTDETRAQDPANGK